MSNEFRTYIRRIEKAGFSEAASRFLSLQGNLIAENKLVDPLPTPVRGAKRLLNVQEMTKKLAIMGKVELQTDLKKAQKIIVLSESLSHHSGRALLMEGFAGKPLDDFRKEYMYYYDPRERERFERDNEMRRKMILAGKSVRLLQVPDTNCEPSISPYQDQLPEHLKEVFRAYMAANFYPRADLQLPEELDLSKFLPGTKVE